MNSPSALSPKCHACPRAEARAVSGVEFPACYVATICQDQTVSVEGLSGTPPPASARMRDRKRVREVMHDLRGLAYSLNLLRSLALLHEDAAQKQEAWRWAHERIFSAEGRDRIDALLAQLNVSLRCELPGTSPQHDVVCYLDALNDTVSRISAVQQRPAR